MESGVYEQFEKLERDHWWFRGRRRVYGGVLEAVLNGSQPQRALDLGCGMGGFQQILRDLCAEVVATDFDHGSLRVCRHRGFEPTVEAESHRLPFSDASFDLICLFDVLEHTPDDHAVMTEIYRLLKPGGLVFLSVPAYQFLFANNDRVAGHYRRYSRGQLLAVFEGAELITERVSYSNVLLFPLIAVAVLLAKGLEAVLGKAEKMQHSNLSWPVPGWLNQLLYQIFSAELAISRRHDWPAGHSLVAAARKPMVEFSDE